MDNISNEEKKVWRWSVYGWFDVVQGQRCYIGSTENATQRRYQWESTLAAGNAPKKFQEFYDINGDFLEFQILEEYQLEGTAAEYEQARNESESKWIAHYHSSVLNENSPAFRVTQKQLSSSKPVTLDDGREFSSITEASRELGLTRPGLSLRMKAHGQPVKAVKRLKPGCCGGECGKVVDLKV